ncbi:MAG: alkaline phosphatase family protein [Eubacteriales bacterium]|nr:alkaline phosphatase family protein [Eubacteriales bacterium]
MKKLIVISADALVFEDLELLKDTPVIGHMMREGAIVKRLRSVYPTVTYVNHTSMRTGCYPAKHGIVCNYKNAPGADPVPWNFYNDAVKCPDLFDAAKAAGYTTASISWPVTGNHKNVDYLVDEIWPLDLNGENGPQPFLDEYTKSGTPDWLLEVISQNVELRMARRQPDTAWFSTLTACSVIRDYNPDLLMLHIANIDTLRHDNGVFNDTVSETVRLTDDLVREIVTAVKANGLLDFTDFVITSDHGQIDVDRQVLPNVIMRDAGLIDVDAEGKVTAWKAWSYEDGGTSAPIVINPSLSDEEKDAVRLKVYKLFKDRIEAGDSGIEKIFKKEEILEEENLAGEFDFWLETDGHTYFDLTWTGEESIRPAHKKGSHGHLPDKGPMSTFIGFGPSFKKGAVIEAAQIVDTAPTYAKILGIDLPDADGHALMGILSDNI